ncbi:DUF305 domain-containing protein [Nocardia mangyaensis]|uniref:DUF305 domain-containing protein n=1 Tax=Nocardia mangyaensis TaxID=2213200 RepID=UPI0026766388|nr:DUF305 domain-containing protein [Nocardia mangyaensis]MDO3646961.1 DUF305 domain-containing protein [Nocardia mangyaensis]
MRWRSGFRVFAFGALALLLLAMGAALRPVLPAATTAPAVLNDTEIGFVQDMVAHHGQALLLTERLDADADPIVVGVARQIADSQRTELGMLLGWLRLAGAPVANARPMGWMPNADHTQRHSAASSVPAMPGMASATELDELAAARGTQAEVLFLGLMRRHHAGGIEMAAAADAVLNDGEVQRSAREMVRTQGQEIGLLSVLLERRGTDPCSDNGMTRVLTCR